PFCEVVDLLTPFRQRGNNLGAGFSLRPSKGCDNTYYDQEPLMLDIAAHTPLQFLYIDYYTADRATVAHILPSQNQPNNALNGASTLSLGGPQSRNPWTIGPPWGTELVTAIASPARLFAEPRTRPEPAGTYVDELRRALPHDLEGSEVIAQ